MYQRHYLYYQPALQPETEDMLLTIGISTYAVPWHIGISGYPKAAHPLGLYEFLDLAVECGVSLVQIGDNLPLEHMTAQELRNLGQALTDRKLSVEVGIRGTAPRHLLQYLEICSVIGARLCRTVIQQSHAVQSLQDLTIVADQFHSQGVYLAIENHGLHTAEELKNLFETLNHPAIGSCVDTTNSFSLLESPKQVLTTLLPYAFNVHIKEFDIKRVPHQMGFELHGASLGEGQLNVVEVIDMIYNSGRNPTIILEQWVPYHGDINSVVITEKKWLHQSIHFLKKCAVW
jgi:3-oxoisoapionate decarboxylase